VFPAGFSLRTMRQLTGGGDTDLLANLTSLVDKNLIQPAPAVAAEPRFVLLDTIREFSVEQARAAGEWDDLQRRLLSHYVDFTLRSTHGLQGSESGTWFKSLDAEHANLTAAIDRALDSPAGSEAWRAGLMILGNLRRYWMLRGHFHLHGQWIEKGRAAIQAFETSETSADPVREDTLRLKAGILALAGSQSWALGEYERSRDWHQASFELYRGLGDERGMGDALNDLAVCQDQLGDHDRAFEHHQQGLELYRKIGDRWGEMRSLNNLGRNLEGLGRAEQALQFLEAGLAIAEELKDDFFLAALLCNVGHVQLQLGLYDQAEAALVRCVERVELREYGYLRAWALADLADVRLARDQLEPAARALRECLRMMDGFGDNNLRQSALMAGAALLMKAGKAETAACIMGSLDEMLIRTRARRTPYEQAQYEALIRKIRLGQSRQQFDAAWRRGRTASMPEMIGLALAHIEAAPAPAADDELRLSRREQDVLRLLARGMTNQQIADELVIVVKTVEKHVAGILVKLGVRNRTQAAASAAARRLLEPHSD
jgi:DNA-binding CsgD family transcriptional regulator/tetratricopeptide (TPR) repeat protein